MLWNNTRTILQENEITRVQDVRNNFAFRTIAENVLEMEEKKDIECHSKEP